MWPTAAALALSACAGNGEPQITGYIEGEYLRVAAPFAGTLQQLAVKRGAQVAAGAPLFALERENETAARREAVERLASAEARLADLQTGKRPPEVETVAAATRAGARGARPVGCELQAAAGALHEQAS